MTDYHAPPLPPVPPPPFIPPPPPQRSLSAKAKALFACGALFGVFMILAAIGSIVNPPKTTTVAAVTPETTDTTAAPTAVTEASTTVAPTTTAAPTITEAPTTTEAPPPPPPTEPPPPPTTSVTQAMTVWAITAQPKILTLQSDLQSVASAAEDGSVPRMVRACVTFQANLADARSMIPTPDAELTSELGAALDAYDAAAMYCIAGGQSYDTDQISLAATYLQRGTPHITNASRIIDSYT